MSIEKIQSGYTFSFVVPYVDSEEKEIMAKLLAYGITPTGNKATDRAKLYQIEYNRAKQEPTVSSNKFLTVSTSEQNKIQEKKQENKKVSNIGDEAISNYNRAFINKRYI